MSNLTNVELNMCITKCLDLFLNLVLKNTSCVLGANSSIYVPYGELTLHVSSELILVFMSLTGNYTA
jgi:hypothetical protein